MWTPSEEKFFHSLHSPIKIQRYLDDLTYNPENSLASPRYVMMTESAHCLEACLVAASALEFLGYSPLLVNLLAHDDDHHALTLYQTKTGWGSLTKSNTTLLGGRLPYYQSVRELVMSYFAFYFNSANKYSLLSFTKPINLNDYNHWDWRTSDHDLWAMGIKLTENPKEKILSLKELKKIPPVTNRLKEACFYGADLDGLYKA